MNQIEIHVDTHYVESESIPAKAQYIFSYTITIKNEGDLPAKLLRRYWLITDGKGHTQEVEGIGVVGDQPLLHPGEEYRYTSGTLLATSMGTMKGKYRMVDDEGSEFDATIPEFLLTVPRVIH